MENITISQRIKLLFESLNLPITKFSEQIGFSQSTISTAINRNSDVTTKVIAAIIKKFDTVNCRWLLLGEGEMFVAPIDVEQKIINGDNNTIHIERSMNNNNSQAYGHSCDCEKVLHEKDLQIAHLEGQIKILKELLINK